MSSSCSLKVRDCLEPNIKGLFDVVLYDHDFFRLHTHSLKIDDCNKLFTGKTYIIVIGGSEIHRGKFVSNVNLFPFENIPLGLLEWHQVQIVIFDVDVPTDSKTTFVLLHEIHVFIDNIGINGSFEMPWIPDEGMDYMFLRFMGGMCGLSHVREYLYLNTEYIDRHETPTEVLNNNVTVYGISHLSWTGKHDFSMFKHVCAVSRRLQLLPLELLREVGVFLKTQPEYHVDAFENLYPNSISKLLTYPFCKEIDWYTGVNVVYETMKLPMKLVNNVATCVLPYGADGFSNFDIITGDKVTEVNVKSAGGHVIFKCLDLVTTKTEVHINDFHNHKFLNAITSNTVPPPMSIEIVFESRIRDKVWLQFNRQIFCNKLRTYVAQLPAYKNTCVDLATCNIPKMEVFHYNHI